MTQLELHNKIDQLIAKDITGVKSEDVSILISANKDARQYFFFKADERWLEWLWENGLLDAIKQRAEDPTRYGYRTPEVNYLVRMAEKVPAKVVDIMLKVPVSAETFNPEVIDGFLRICATLPASQLSRLVRKIRDEKWISLMGVFNQWGFEYEKMFNTLADAKKYEELLILAEAVLFVRQKEDIEKTTNHISTENPFYFSDLSYTKVFEHLANIPDEYTESALALATKILGEIVLLGGKAENGEVFPIKETFYLFDVDLFTIEPSKGEHLSHRDNVHDLIAVIRVFLERLIGNKCDRGKDVRLIYKKYIKPLPESSLVWRLRLFTLSLCPEIFKAELKQSFLRLFEVGDRYGQIISSEYERALKKCFVVLEDADRREYVKRVIEYFSKQTVDNEEQQWRRNDGSEILSVIIEHLTADEEWEAKEKGFELNPSYEPVPSISEIRSGFIQPQGPITPEEFHKLPVEEIARKLRDEWSPARLREQYKDDDFLRPHNAEGAGELLSNDIAKRLQDYINNANLFFERGALAQHYTYSFLHGVRETIKNRREDASKINWEGLINLFLTIKSASEKEPFERDRRERSSFDSWFADWQAVHLEMADVLQELLTERDDIVVIEFPKYRGKIFEILAYLLGYPDPLPKDEQGESAKISQKTESGEYIVSDPLTIAINSVRGRAFQTLLLFIYQDEKRFSKEDKIKVSSDIKKLYEIVLNRENTRAIMFMFGHYLPAFYFRDKEWILTLLPEIFPEEPDKKHLYTAAWEGYLANNLFGEMFFNEKIQKLYERGLALTEAEYPKQRHFRDPDESLAVHLALAYMYYYKRFGFDHRLFDAFWAKDNPEQHASFISFLGRMFISGDNTNANELLKKEPRSKQQLKDLWNWMLKDYRGNSRPFVEFGVWINLEKDIFKPTELADLLKRTLEKTEGVLDWDYELMKSIVQLAKEAPKDTLEIARLFLFEGGVKRGRYDRITIHIDREWLEALKILYQNPDTKQGTYALIDDLIREGGSIFWVLKTIVE